MSDDSIRTTTSETRVLEEAKRLAALDGHHWTALTLAGKHDYETAARTDLGRQLDELHARRAQRQAHELDDTLGQLMDRAGVGRRDNLVTVVPGHLAAARQAASRAATAQRLVDLAHLHECLRVVDGVGPVVLWADVERVMPLPE